MRTPGNLPMTALPLALVLALAGCDASDREAETADDGMAPAEQPAETGAAVPGTGAAEEIEVRLDDFTVEMPETLPAGRTTFRVTNAGTVDHNFEVEGQGIEEEFDEDLAPGDTRTMTLDLEPGEYHVYCPVGDHEERGMELTLTVEEGATAGDTGGGSAAGDGQGVGG